MNPEVKNPGYHIREIKKGVLGQSSKIREELEELMDAEEQGLKVMQLVELSDLLGAINAYVGKNFPGISMTDLELFAQVTARAFRNGHRGITVQQLSRQVAAKVKFIEDDPEIRCFSCGRHWADPESCSECG